MSPVRSLDGITYLVIEEPIDISDFVRTVLKKEWEADLRSEGKDPVGDPWLDDLLERRWKLEIMRTLEVRPESDYVKSERLKHRRGELRKALELGSVIWPIVVRAEGMLLADG